MTMNNFEKWDALFRSQNMSSFNLNSNGILWLKVKAICRKKYISQFLELNNIQLKTDKVSLMNRELFELLEHREDALKILDSYLQDINNEWYERIGVDKDKLKEDLYKVRSYSWGGDQNNSLDKYLVNHFVKVVNDFTELERRKSEIATNAWHYVVNSWYNNWTSFLIESIFKCNSRVVSAVGEIKSVDFFIGGFPIDLKVTFFPNQFMEEKLRLKLGKYKLSWLKCKSKTVNITVDKNSSVSQQIYTLKEKLDELGHTEILDELKSAEQDVIRETRANPIELMKWLYENQGEMRFGAENRLYLILINTESLEQSWKLKRAINLIEPTVNKYLDSFSQESLKPINFNYKGSNYKSLADTIFIVR